MGEVYRARDTKLGRDVAIKILPARRSRATPSAWRVSSARRGCSPPSIIRTSARSTASKTRTASARWCLNWSTARRWRIGSPVGPSPLKDALPIARQIAEALDAAHEKGIVHRDLKPRNVALTRDGTVKVLDFGLAKRPAAMARQARFTHAPTMTIGGTREGVVLGTAAYMSPEQARGQAVDKRTDIWAFGCVLYEMLTRHVAFPGKTISRHHRGRPRTRAELGGCCPPRRHRPSADCCSAASRRIRSGGCGTSATRLFDVGCDCPASEGLGGRPPARW